jgi:hypothetical protein
MESTEDKTKRKLASLIARSWSYQYSFFLDSSIKMVEVGNIIRKKLKDNGGSEAFLTSFRMLNRDKELQCYFTVYTTNKISETLILSIKIATDAAVVSRKTRIEKLQSTARAVRKQNPHNLDNFFQKKIPRYSVIGRKYLPPELPAYEE